VHAGANDLTVHLVAGSGPLAAWLLNQGSLSAEAEHGRSLTVDLAPGRRSRSTSTCSRHPKGPDHLPSYRGAMGVGVVRLVDHGLAVVALAEGAVRIFVIRCRGR